MKHDKIDEIYRQGNCKNVIGEYDDPYYFVPMWQYGDDFDTDKYKIMFVGKVARGKFSTEEAVATAKNLYECEKESWSFWRYTKEIVNHVYNCDANSNENWEKIAITNLIKFNCDNPGDSTVDKTTKEIKTDCFETANFIKTEVNAVKPKHIIFYTAGAYDTEIRKSFDVINEKFIENVQLNNKYTCTLWTFEIKGENGPIYCLRCPHPQGKTKSKFVGIISNWIKSEKDYSKGIYGI